MAEPVVTEPVVAEPVVMEPVVLEPVEPVPANPWNAFQHQVGGAGLKQKEMSLLYKVSRPGSPQLKWNSFQSATKQQGISTQRKALMWKKYKEIRMATTIASPRKSERKGWRVLCGPTL